MLRKIISICLLATSSVFGGVEADISSALNSLSAESFRASFELFHKHPKETAGQIIQKLEVIPRGKYGGYSGNEMNQMIWYFRALHSVTGVRFYGKTEAELTDEEKNFLTQERGELLNYYGTWISRDITYVAPADAQKKIILQWNHWLKTIDKQEFKSEKSINDWYFK